MMFNIQALAGGDKPSPLHEDKSEPQNIEYRIPNIECRRVVSLRSVELQKKAGINRRPRTKKRRKVQGVRKKIKPCAITFFPHSAFQLLNSCFFPARNGCCKWKSLRLGYIAQVGLRSGSLAAASLGDEEIGPIDIAARYG